MYRILDDSYFELTKDLQKLRPLATHCHKTETALAKSAPNRRVRELPDGISPDALKESGWGVIFSKKEIERGAKDRLKPLLDLRKQQAGGNVTDGGRFLSWEVQNVSDPLDFLYEHLGSSPGTIRPHKVPYYLLLVASPQDIPFDVQFALSVNHAVGRIHFRQVEHYAFYADAVCGAEEQPPERPRRADLFAVQGAEDSTLEQLDSFLVQPLQKRLAKLDPSWSWQGARLEDDSRDCLLRRLNGEDTPGILLTSCHGLSYERSDSGQSELQGALLCSDGQVQASDLEALDPTKRSLHGLVAWMFSCFGAGTSHFENYPVDYLRGSNLPKYPEQLTDLEFLSRLPEILLANGALAVLGHVNRGWTLSFRWLHKFHVLESAQSLEDSLVRFLRGARLGHAIRPLARRYSAVTAQLVPMIEALDANLSVHDYTLRLHRIAAMDARGFIVLGDPAVNALGQPTDKVSVASPGVTSTFAEPVFVDPELAQRIRQEAEAQNVNSHDWIQKTLRYALDSGHWRQGD